MDTKAAVGVCVCIEIEGIVQGVGFRPFVGRMAARHQIAGSVQNRQGAVYIEAVGDKQAVEAFAQALQVEKPPESVIFRFSCVEQPLEPDKALPQGFVIAPSQGAEAGLVMPSPDLAVCPDCLREMNQPGDPRYQNPFISCTHCGPRFSILTAIPYDRAHTSMGGFPLCPLCDREYKELDNRRFHAQTVCCNQCGPTLRFQGREGQTLTGQEALRRAVQGLREGQVLAVKGIGGYHLATDATHQASVEALREIKRREAKPFAVMFRDMDTLLGYAQASHEEQVLLQSPARPIVLLRRKASALVPQVYSTSPDVGAFLPYTPLQHMLLAHLPPLVMTSMNLSALPIVAEDGEALAFLRHTPALSGVLYHDRAIVNPQDDSVLQVVDGKPLFLRRSRGFVPLALPLPGGEGLALGAQEKSVFTVVKDGYAYPSAEQGDLDGLENLDRYREALGSMQTLLSTKPGWVAYDCHPEYTVQALAAPLPGHKQPVFHHHAHIASVMAEHDLQGPVIGVAFDGTGYGPDSTVWGGEFLVATRQDFRRAAHLKPVRMLGGEESVRKAWLTAQCYRYDAGKRDGLDPLVEGALDHRVNTWLCSSMGRLFDGVSSLLGLCHVSTYGGQCAIALSDAAAAYALEHGQENMDGEVDAQEKRAEPPALPLPYTVGPQGIIDFAPALLALLGRQAQGEATGRLAYAFHGTVADMVLEVATRLAEAEGLRTVCLSGGVFQNRLLLEMILARLRVHGFLLYWNQAVPPGDGGISLGQAAIALATQKEGTDDVHSGSGQAD